MCHPTSTRQLARRSVRLLSQASLPPRAEIKGDPSAKFNVRIDICLMWTGHALAVGYGQQRNPQYATIGVQ
jgi:hypothetical protein